MLHVLTDPTWGVASASPSFKIKKRRAFQNSKYKNPASRALIAPRAGLDELLVLNLPD
jgi:hypothetical protein